MLGFFPFHPGPSKFYQQKTYASGSGSAMCWPALCLPTGRIAGLPGPARPGVRGAQIRFARFWLPHGWFPSSFPDGVLPSSFPKWLNDSCSGSFLALTHQYFQSFNPLGFSSGGIFEGFRQAFDALHHFASDKPSMLRAISRQNPGGTAVFSFLFFSKRGIVDKDGT